MDVAEITEVPEVVEVAEAAVEHVSQTTGAIRDWIRSFLSSLGLSGLSTILSALVVFLICLLAIRIITRLADRIFEKSKRTDPTVRHFLRTALKIVLWAVAVVIVAGTLGIPTASLVAVISVAGVALSLSMQNILTNLFSGITLLLTRPMSVGDFVEIGPNTGKAYRIGLFYTTLIGLNKQVITIPNGDVASASIINYNREPYRRVQFTFGAHYDDATRDVLDALLDAARETPLALSDPAPEAFISSYRDSNIEYGLNVWCRPNDYWDVVHGVNALVREQYEKHGVHMSYNHINVHMIP